MKTAQQGFTLIELVVVIVILGILAATAVPKFIDLSEEAEVAALEGLAGALSSASAINYGAAKVGNSSAFQTNGADCSAIATALLEAGYDSSVTFTGTVATTDGTVSDCTLSKTGVTGTAVAKVIAVTP